MSVSRKSLCVGLVVVTACGRTALDDDFGAGGAGDGAGGSSSGAAGAGMSSGRTGNGGRATSGGRIGAGGRATSGGAPTANGGSSGGGGDCAARDDCVACPPNTGSEIYVDPVDGSEDEPGRARPTGVQYPAACRFKTLTQGIVNAKAGGVVIAFNEAARPDNPAVFSGEKFPLIVPDGVGLRSDDRDSYEIVYDGAETGVAVVLGDVTSFQGFTVRGGVGGTLISAPGKGVSLHYVRLANGNRSNTLELAGSVIASQLDVTGGKACLHVSGAAEVAYSTFRHCSMGLSSSGQLSGLELTFESNGDGVAVLDGFAELRTLTVQESSPQFAGGGTGVILSGGKLSVQAGNIRENIGPGVTVTAGSLELLWSDVRNNGYPDFLGNDMASGSGVDLRGGFSARIENTTIFGSAMHGVHVAEDAEVGELRLDTVNLDQHLLAGLQIDGTLLRLGITNSKVMNNGEGGIVIQRSTELAAFAGNAIYGNGNHQLEFRAPESKGTWRLGGFDCGDANEIGCYNGDPVAVFAAENAPVDARYTLLQYLPPIAGRDFLGPVSFRDPCGLSGICPGH